MEENLMSWEIITGLAITFAVNIAALAYQAGNFNNKLERLATDLEMLQQEIKESRPLKGELTSVREILLRLEVRVNQLIDFRLDAHTQKERDSK